MTPAGRQHFRDQQEFGDFVRNRIGMEYASYQLVAGPSAYECDYVHFEDENIWVARTRPLQSEFTEFVVPAGYLMVSICRDPVEVFCNRWRIDLQPVLLFPGGQKIRGVFPLGYEAFDILLPFGKLREFGVREPVCAELEELTDPLICEIDSTAAQDFFALMSSRMASLSASPPSDQSGALRAMFLALGDRLSGVLDTDILANRAREDAETRRADIVAAATSYLDANLTTATSIERMAADIGVSSRLLAYAFQDAIGLSPYQFVLLKRLHNARDAIRRSNDPIREIAVRMGFTKPSRFRRQYCRLFGELPGETRRRSLAAAALANQGLNPGRVV